MEHFKETGDGITEETFLLLHETGEVEGSGPAPDPILCVGCSCVCLKGTKENNCWVSYSKRKHIFF